MSPTLNQFFSQFSYFDTSHNRRIAAASPGHMKNFHKVMQQLQIAKKTYLVAQHKLTHMLSFGESLTHVAAVLREINKSGKSELITSSHFQRFLQNHNSLASLADLLQTLNLLGKKSLITRQTFDRFFANPTSVSHFGSCLEELYLMNGDSLITQKTLIQLLSCGRNIGIIFDVLLLLRQSKTGQILTESNWNALLGHARMLRPLKDLLRLWAQNDLLKFLNAEQLTFLINNTDKIALLETCFLQLISANKHMLLSEAEWKKLLACRSTAESLFLVLNVLEEHSLLSLICARNFAYLIESPTHGCSLLDFMTSILSTNPQIELSEHVVSLFFEQHRNSNDALLEVFSTLRRLGAGKILTSPSLSLILVSPSSNLPSLVKLLNKIYQLRKSFILTGHNFETLIAAASSEPELSRTLNYLNSYHPSVALSEDSFSIMLHNHTELEQLNKLLRFMKNRGLMGLISLPTLLLMISHISYSKNSLDILRLNEAFGLMGHLESETLSRIISLKEKSTELRKILLEISKGYRHCQLSPTSLRELVKSPDNFEEIACCLEDLRTYQSNDCVVSKALHHLITCPPNREKLFEVIHALCEMGHYQQLNTHSMSAILEFPESIEHIATELEALDLLGLGKRLSGSHITEIFQHHQLSCQRSNILFYLNKNITSGRSLSVETYLNLLRYSSSVPLAHALITLWDSAGAKELLTENNCLEVLLGAEKAREELLNFYIDLQRAPLPGFASIEVFLCCLHSQHWLARCHELLDVAQQHSHYSFMTKDHILSVLNLGDRQSQMAVSSFLRHLAVFNVESLLTADNFTPLIQNTEIFLSVAKHLSYLSHWAQHRPEFVSVSTKLIAQMFQQPLDHAARLNNIFEQVVAADQISAFSPSHLLFLVRAPKSFLDVLFTVCEDDPSQRILCHDVIASLIRNLDHLDELQPALALLAEAKAGLITATTCDELLAISPEQRLDWAKVEAVIGAPEKQLENMPLPENMRVPLDLIKILRLYRILESQSRGGFDSLRTHVLRLVQQFKEKPQYLKWAEPISSYFLEGCVNQPVWALAEIQAWLYVASQRTVYQKFAAVRYPYLIFQINIALRKANEHLDVEVEKGNALLREIAMRNDMVASWPGIPQRIAYEGAITSWINEQLVLISQLNRQVTRCSPQDILEFLMNNEFLMHWAPITFPHHLEKLNQDMRNANDILHELMEWALSSEAQQMTKQEALDFWTAETQPKEIQEFQKAHQLFSVEAVSEYMRSLQQKSEALMHDSILGMTQLIAQDCTNDPKNFEIMSSLPQPDAPPPSPLLMSLSSEQGAWPPPERRNIV